MRILLGLFLVCNLLLSGFAFASADYIVTNANTKKNKKFNAQVETRRIPKGTRLKVKLQDAISTKSSMEGEMFSAVLLTDKNVDNAMILPSGTLIRGYVSQIKSAKLASIGAVLYLKFDHLVSPTGTQLPVSTALSYNTENVAKITVDGGLRMQAGYGDALKENWNTTKKIVSNSTSWGFEQDNVVARAVLTPVGAIGGTLGGTLFLVGDSILDIFKKGKHVFLNQGDIVEIIILKDLDVPVI